MPIRKPSSQATPKPSSSEIERVINAGSPPPKEDIAVEEREIKFQMVIPGELCQLIDQARALTKTSRRTWLLQAAQEKLERQGKL
jgi:hypothetical protein